ncbi:MAG: aspartate-semialdehyde dehydrogenase, partial [Candidatus Hydrothermarchaeota archaeon]|nr:aspartate-semialdehyde dehydrogenase [Candidatus Hydrothermarchaeota archaeon]
MKVAVLGATGMVGQRFIERLANHPFFELSDLAASSRSAGKKYGEAAKWVLDIAMPEKVKGAVIKEVDPKKIKAEIVFSALPSEIAREVEPKFAREGFIVASNASAYRMEKDVPIMVPEINPEHLDLLEVQKENRRWDGCIFTDPNCSIAAAILSLKPIYDKFGIKSVFIAT